MKNSESTKLAAYATADDFCRIFSEDMSKLYLLAFLLIADSETAEQCFASALEDCLNSSRVFREWARSWSRRAVIQNAVRLAGADLDCSRGDWQPQPESPAAALPERLSAITRLSTFERFLHVMSVLEHYTDQDCAALLHCRRQQVVEGRQRALQNLVPSIQQASVPRGFATSSLLAETA